MKVNEYLLNHPNKSAYTVKLGRKSYLCDLLECAQVFGNKDIKKIGCGKNFDNTISNGLPILYLT